MIEQAGDVVRVTETDPHGRVITWTYRRGHYQRAWSLANLPPGDADWKQTSELQFGAAFWRAWKHEQGIH